MDGNVRPIKKKNSVESVLLDRKEFLKVFKGLLGFDCFAVKITHFKQGALKNDGHFVESSCVIVFINWFSERDIFLVSFGPRFAL